MECDLAGGERAWPSIVGGVLTARNSGAYLHTQSGLWNSTPGLSFWLQWEAASWFGLAYTVAPQLSCSVLEFSPVNDRVTSLHVQVRDRSLTVVSAYELNSSAHNSAFLEEYWKVVWLGTPSFHWEALMHRWAATVFAPGREGYDWEGWPPQSKPGWCVFCWSSNLITGYPFEHLAPGPLGRRSMINFAIAWSDLGSYCMSRILRWRDDWAWNWSPHGGKTDPLTRA